MPLGLGFLKGLKLVKTVRVADAVSKVGKVTGLGKVGLAIKELPVVRIVAGSAIGIAAIDWWNKSRRSLSETLGITESESSILIVVAIAAALALLISLFRRR